jgi:predicted RNase H-like nuclease (RuvC/YqgF family)
LQEELVREEQLLEEAVQKLREGEENPEVYRGKDGKIYRNVVKYEEKIKALNYQVEQHQKNIELLKSALSNLK